MNFQSHGISIFRTGAWSSVILLLYSFTTILIVAFIGGPPQSVMECFDMLEKNRLTGFLRLDILTVFVMPLYFILFYALYVALKEVSQTASALSLLFIVVGVTLFLAAPSVFSYSYLSDRFHAAGSEADRNIFSTAAEGILAADIWNGTGPRIGGLLVQTGAIVFSLLMLRSQYFPKYVAYIGIATHGLDLLHIPAGFFSPAAANGIMSVAGVLYLVWFPMMAFHLKKIKSTTAINASGPQTLSA